MFFFILSPVAFEKELLPTAKRDLLLFRAGFKFKQTDESMETWEKDLALLFDFQQTHGHTRVPKDDGEFGAWVERQRCK